MRKRYNGEVVLDPEIESLYPPLTRAAERRIVTLHRIECDECSDTAMDTHVLHHMKQYYRKAPGNHDCANGWPPKVERSK